MSRFKKREGFIRSLLKTWQKRIALTKDEWLSQGLLCVALSIALWVSLSADMTMAVAPWLWWAFLSILLFLILWTLWRIGFVFAMSFLSMRKNQGLKQSSGSTFAAHIGARFPEQWKDFEHIFRDLADVRLWELRKGHSQLVVKLRYRRNCIYTWFSFLKAIALGSIKKAIVRLSK